MATANSRIFALNRQLFNTSLYYNIFNFWFAGLPSSATVPSKELQKRWFGGNSPSEKSSFDSQCVSKFRSALDSISPTNYPLPSGLDGTLIAERRSAYEIAKPFLPDLMRPDVDEATTVALSLLILLDQIPRNVFRDRQTPIYRHFDVIARSILRCVIGEEDSTGGALSGKKDGDGVEDGYRPPTIPRFDLRPRLRGVPVLRMFMMMPFMHSEFMEDHVVFEKMAADMRSTAKGKDDTVAVGKVDELLGFESKHKEIIERFGRYPYRNDACERKTTEEERRWMEEGGETFTA